MCVSISMLLNLLKHTLCNGGGYVKTPLSVASTPSASQNIEIFRSTLKEPEGRCEWELGESWGKVLWG